MTTGSADGGRPRQARTVLGGRIGVGRPGLVTQILAGTCVVVYILQQGSDAILRDYSLLGYQIAFADEYYRLLTPAFLHLSLIHVLFNVLALYVLGTQLEQMLGRIRYVALFVVCAVGGNATSYLVNGAQASSAGASTAVYGFFAAYFMVARRLRADTSQILVIVGINLVITFALPGIDRWGHLGGLAAGIALGAIFSYVPPRLVVVQAALVGAVLAGFVLTAVVESNEIVDDWTTRNQRITTSEVVPPPSGVVEPVAFHDLGDPVGIGTQLAATQ
nr:rhomboid family intramembrane serine protease [Micromonospora sp. DSM 115978]